MILMFSKCPFQTILHLYCNNITFLFMHSILCIPTVLVCIHVRMTSVVIADPAFVTAHDIQLPKVPNVYSRLNSDTTSISKVEFFSVSCLEMPYFWYMKAARWYRIGQFPAKCPVLVLYPIAPCSFHIPEM